MIKITLFYMRYSQITVNIGTSVKDNQNSAHLIVIAFHFVTKGNAQPSRGQPESVDAQGGREEQDGHGIRYKLCF